MKKNTYELQIVRWLLILFMLLLGACRPQEDNTQPTPTLTSIRITPQITDIPSPTPTETLAPSTRTPPCAAAPMNRLIVQERGRVTDNGEKLNLRRGPGTDQQIIQRIDPGEIFMVLDGPTCAETYVWYQVDYQGAQGWIAEGDFERYYTEPYLPG